MATVHVFQVRQQKVAGLMEEIEAFRRGQREAIAAAPDDALVEVHDRLRREMAAGTISFNYANVLQALAAEIGRRGLNVVRIGGAK